MRFDTRRATVVALGVLLLAAIFLTAGPVIAKKPVKPPPPPPTPVDGGTIYFSQGGALNRMDPDGSNVAALPSAIQPGAEPSILTHGGRWFLQVQTVPGATYPGTYPGTTVLRPQLELFAVHESGSPAVQLTNGRTTGTTFIEPNNALQGAIEVQPRWTAGDTRVSYMALRTSYDAAGNRTIEDGGIYAVTVDPTALPGRMPTAMSGPALLPLVLIPNGIAAILNRHYDWKPDGSAIVFHTVIFDTVGRVGIWIARASDGFMIPELLVDNGANLRWSPDGTRILYQYGDIYSIKADGTEDEQLLVEDPEDNKSLIQVKWQCWSPSSTHIAYTYYKFDIRKSTASYDVMRATDSGGDQANLSTGSVPVWRE